MQEESADISFSPAGSMPASQNQNSLFRSSPRHRPFVWVIAIIVAIGLVVGLGILGKIALDRMVLAAVNPQAVAAQLVDNPQLSARLIKALAANPEAQNVLRGPQGPMGPPGPKGDSAA